MKKMYMSPEIELIYVENEVITSSVGDYAPDIDGGADNGFVI